MNLLKLNINYHLIQMHQEERFSMCRSILFFGYYVIDILSYVILAIVCNGVSHPIGQIYDWLIIISISNITIGIISIGISMFLGTNRSIITFRDLVHFIIVFLFRIALNLVSLILVWNNLMNTINTGDQYTKLYLYALFLPSVLFIWIVVLYKHYQESETPSTVESINDDQV